MPLKLKLAAHEQLVVNGAVMVNGDSRTTLIVRNFAHILREKDVLQARHANTPTKRLYFQIQAMLLQAPAAKELMAEYAAQLALLRRAYARGENLAVLERVECMVVSGDYYKALRHLQSLIATEAALLNCEPPAWRHSKDPQPEQPTPAV